MKNIFIGLAPNYEKDDLWLCLKLLFSPQKWQKGLSIHQLESSFRKYFKIKYAFSFASGRTALWAILQALRIKRDEEVLLQAYTCVVVPNAVKALGARPIWVEINPETFNLDTKDLEKKITPQSRVIIVQHTFGKAAAVRKIKRLAKKNKLVVIEDCAQSLGGKYAGKNLGSLTEASFFSFGRDKIISSVFGGMAITNNEKIGERLKEIQAKLSFPPRIWICQQLLHPLILTLIIKTYSFFSLGKYLHFCLQRLGLLSKAVFEQEKKGQMPTILITKMPNALAQLARQQFAKLEKFNRQRQKIACFYQENLQGLPFVLPRLKNEQVFLRFTIRTKKAKELIATAQKEAVFLGDWYRPVIAPKGVDPKQVFYQPGSCPKAEKVSNQSVNLPTYPTMTLKEVQRIVNLIKKIYGN